MGSLPLIGLHALGRVLGTLYWLFPTRERRTARINIALCFPALSDAGREQLCRRSLQHLGRSLMELSIIWFGPMARVSRLVRQVSGEEHLQREPGQGLILLVPHLGCWEITGLMLSQREQVTSLYRPPRKQEMEALIKKARERSGGTLVPTDNKGVKQIYQNLQQGGTTIILPDQRPSSTRGSVFAPFFNHPALTMVLANRLARKTGAKILIGYAERLPWGRGYHFHYLPAPQGIDDRDPQRAAEALNLGLESVIRDCPEQYQWTYKRFLDQPGDNPSPYRKQQ